MTANAIDLQLGRHVVALARTEWGAHALEPIGPYLSALLPLVPESELQRRWHVVQTESQKEFKVADEINKAGFDAWCPKMPRNVRVRAEVYRKVQRPLLSTYVLAGFDADYEPWEMIRPTQYLHGQRMEGMRGVVRLLMIEQKPVPLGDAEVTRLAMREAEEAAGRCAKSGAIPPAIGTLVRVLTGPFVGFLGFVVTVHKHEVDVELDIFRRKTPVTLEWGQIEAV